MTSRTHSCTASAGREPARPGRGLGSSGGVSSGSGLVSWPECVQKLLFVCVQRRLVGNDLATDYFARRSGLAWVGRTPNRGPKHESWSSLLVLQAEDGFGATVLLGQIFKVGQGVKGSGRK